MLLRFGVENHRSIRARQELSMVTSAARAAKVGAIKVAGSSSMFVVPSAVVYGANASGKSNLVSSFRFLRAAVLSSHSQGQAGGDIRRLPFALNSTHPELPTVLDIDFVVDGVRYQYGFGALDKAFVSEWLYSFPYGKQQTLFFREGQEFRFSRKLKGRNRIISELTRPNSLFLSAALQNDHEEISRIATFFQHLHTDSSISLDGNIASMRLARAPLDDRVVEFLRGIGTGVVGYRKKKYEQPPQIREITKAFVTAFEQAQKSPLLPDQEIEILDNPDQIELGHESESGQPVYFPLSLESTGTRRLLVVLGPVFRALDRGSVVVIDELDASLHTIACAEVLALFSSKETNPNGAQLIATTHDTNLLRDAALDRDQVWFTEKTPDGATEVYPLSDIRTRAGDDYEKGYLQGRYGAVPFSGSLPRHRRAT